MHRIITNNYLIDLKNLLILCKHTTEIFGCPTDNIPETIDFLKHLILSYSFEIKLNTCMNDYYIPSIMTRDDIDELNLEFYKARVKKNICYL
jgi:hypothetical protein